MNDDTGDDDVRPQSKFEWRPEDIIILSKEEGDAAVAEFEQWRAEVEGRSVDDRTDPPLGESDRTSTDPEEPT